MKIYDIYVGGKFKKTGFPLLVENPYNREIFAQTWQATTDDLNEAIFAAQAAEREMKNLPSFKKYEILMQIANELTAQRQYLAGILALESGKPMRYALGEIDRAAQTFLVAAEEAKRLPREYISLDWTPAGAGKEGLIKYFPIGLVAGIAPFNFPLNLAVHKIAPAIAAGNVIILKPARSTPLSTLELAKIIDKTDLPKGAFSVLPLDRKAGNQLVTDERIKMLSFTGSPAIGWQMKQQAGRKKVLLELGGNAGVIVSDSANLDIAVGKCLVGSFAYSGQVCIHVQRIYIHEKVFERFVEKFIEGTKKLKYGDPQEATTEISSMIDEDNAIRVENWVDEAVTDGAKILHGGKRNGTYFEPTIITNTKKQMNVCALEIFGPVVTLEKVKDFETSIFEINDSQYGLQAGVFTDSLEEMNRAFNELEVGGVVLNDVPSFRVDHMPYGGLKNSGFGREGLKYSIFEQMEPKLLVKPI
jgi:glyceraldehyde-3-phosphate dehydrogenase (NADP+)